MAEQDLLIEIGTEELPPKALLSLSEAFDQEVRKGLSEAKLAHGDTESYATPRRLAILIRDLKTQQPDSIISKLGPAVKAAFDAEGKPTKAAEGFARSCGVNVEDLDRHDDGKVTKLLYKATQDGVASKHLIGDIVSTALGRLPIPKRMRWGSSRVEFVRPVHWVVLLFGEEVIPATILGMETGRHTRGHRFHHPQSLELSAPADYAALLGTSAYVIASFAERRERIRQQVEDEGHKLEARAIIDDALLDEVTALVEWPVALCGDFDPGFLEVPKEALISSMKEHQKCFYLLDADGNILPNFITVSNLESKYPAEVIQGNERVIRPRLADAAFFYEQDRQHSLASRRDKLKTVIFQQQLGTLHDKSERVRALAVWLAGRFDMDAALSERAAQLGKCDLLTSMVYEFAELQGIMGSYYARHDGESEEVAQALYEQYLPRFAGDQLPAGNTGIVLALAERLDSITGLFGIGQPPTGSKDPFALRRAALGLLRILIEKQLDLDLHAAVAHAANNFDMLPERKDLEASVLDFVFDRLRAWYADQGISAAVFQAVDAVRPHNALEFDLRIKAVSRFRELPEAEALAAAHKRVSNILAKLEQSPCADVDRSLLNEEAEIDLADALEQKVQALEPHFRQREYTAVLESLASLQPAVDRFFDEVMVNTENDAIRDNRLALLQQLRMLFLRIADISHLQ